MAAAPIGGRPNPPRSRTDRRAGSGMGMARGGGRGPGPLVDEERCGGRVGAGGERYVPCRRRNEGGGSLGREEVDRGRF